MFESLKGQTRKPVDAYRDLISEVGAIDISRWDVVKSFQAIKEKSVVVYNYEDMDALPHDQIIDFGDGVKGVRIKTESDRFEFHVDWPPFSVIGWQVHYDLDEYLYVDSGIVTERKTQKVISAGHDLTIAVGEPHAFFAGPTGASMKVLLKRVDFNAKTVVAS